MSVSLPRHRLLSRAAVLLATMTCLCPSFSCLALEEQGECVTNANDGDNEGILLCAERFGETEVNATDNDSVVDYDDEFIFDEECLDDLCQDSCQKIAGQDKNGCINLSITMSKYCSKTCHYCKYSQDFLNQLKQETQQDKVYQVQHVFSDVPQNIYSAQGLHMLKWLRAVEQYMYDTVYDNDKYVKVRSKCRNTHANCTVWASVYGECDKNPWMKTHCAPACFSCDQLDQKLRCPFDPHAPVALYPGDLDKMFQRIMTKPTLKQYNPTAIMQPNPPQDCDTQEGPWLVVLDNFLTPEECDILIQLGADKGYHQSIEVGEEQPDGSYGSVRNDQRTSENAWCTQECYEDNVTQAIHDRMELLTGIDRNNYEYLQLLRYQQGQFYGEHHDYIPHERNERFQGVRVSSRTEDVVCAIGVSLFSTFSAHGRKLSFCPAFDCIHVPK